MNQTHTLISEKSIWKNQVQRTRFLVWSFTACVAQPTKLNFEIDFCRLTKQVVKLDFSNLILQKLSTDQQYSNRLSNIFSKGFVIPVQE